MESTPYRRALIVGGGAMAIDHHLPRIFTLLGVEHVDIFDIDPRRRALLARRFRRNRRIALIERILEHAVYDIVLVSTPPKFHYDFYAQLEDQSPAFLIEKPLALNASQAASIEASAARNNVSVFVNLIRRSLRSFQLVKQFCASERFGKLQHVTVAEGDVFGWRATSLGSFSRDLNGGGVLMDTGPHTLDLLIQVFDRLELDSARMDGSQHTIEANCTLRMTADDRIPITVSLSRSRHLSNTAYFQFENATCAAAVRDNAITVTHPDGEHYMIYPPDTATTHPLTFTDLNDAFYRQFLVPGDNASVNASQSREVLGIIDRAYEIAEPLRGPF